MQKWYNDGYFSVDLPMKRTHYDTHWTTVGELVKQSNGENVFLRPLISAIPPGLGRANGSPLQTYPQTDHPFNEPYQPAPVRSLRASTLESYLMAGSVPSDSPSSSIGASHSSPDPSMFGTRNKIYGSDVGINGRSTGLGVQEYFTPFTEKRTSHDYPSDSNGTQLPSFGNFGPERDLNMNGFGSNDAYATHDPWKIPLALNVGFPDHKSHPVISSNRQDLADTNNSTTNAFSQGTAYVSPDISYQQSGYIQSDHTPFESFGSSVQDKDVLSPPSATVSGFWGNVSRRPGVRDVELLTSASVGVLPNPTALSSWPRIDDAPISGSQLIGNTLNNPDGLSDAAWKVDPRPSNLTTELEGQQDEEEENAEVGTSYDQVPEQFILDAPMRTLSNKTPNKVVSQPSPVNQPSVINQSSTINHPTLVEPPPTPKVAWAKEEDIKKKASGISVSLREIQEAEAKKLESRKALEREKERSARVTAESKEDIQPFTASWGLPTSQAGSRNSLPIRETPAVPVSSPTAAVWTTPSHKQPAIKRTMKEIQEEEEKHKKQISKEIVAANAKRAYADSTAKVSLFHRSL
jgi:PERQ amino acid-rich with GYF domain-containing protein